MTTPSDIPNYNQSAPALTDVLAKSQKDFRNSFRNEFAVFGLNHLFDNLTTDGNHTIIQLYSQVTGPQTNTNELAIYSKLVPNQTTDKEKDVYQVFFRAQKGGQEIQLTNYQIYSLAGDEYFTTLPGGFIVYFGQLASMKAGSKFKPTPFCTNLVGVALTPISTGTGLFPSFFQYRIDSNGLKNGIYLYSTVVTSKNPSPAQYYIMIGNF